MMLYRLAPTCPGWLGFTRRGGLLILGASIVLHIMLFALLPSMHDCLSATLPPELLVKLRIAEPDARIRPAATQPSEAEPQVQPAHQLHAPLGALPPVPKPVTASRQPTPAKPDALVAGGTVRAGTASTLTGGDGPAVAPGSGTNAVGAGGHSASTGGPSGEGQIGGSGAGNNPSRIAPALTPPPAPPKPQPKPAPAIDVKALLASYARGVKASILRHKTYPAIAERLAHEGAAKVSFTIDANGSLQSATVRSSSGYDELDEAALNAVRSAAPFESIPAEVGKDQLSMSITLKFSLGG